MRPYQGGDDLPLGELAIALAGLRRDARVGVKPGAQIVAKQDAIRGDMLAVIGALDQSAQFLPGLTDGPPKRFGEALAIRTPAQPVMAGRALVNPAIAVRAAHDCGSRS